MALGSFVVASRAAVFVLALAGLVHATLGQFPAHAQSMGSSPQRKGHAPQAAPSVPRSAPDVREGLAGLPAPVLEMREAILAAVKSGRLDDLMTAIELNEIKPTFSDGPVADPIAHLRKLSTDGEGRDVLAALADILEAGYVALPLGRDIENNRIYVWPHFAETGVADLSPASEVELYRLVPVAEARRMRQDGQYDFWRIGIGADGVWHFLLSGPVR
jgi:hypothetical protein